MSIIYRTADLVTPTTSVLAIDHAGHRRLACRTPGLYPRLVIEGHSGNGDWGYMEDVSMQPQERLVPDARNRLGNLGAYCHVVAASDLKELARSQGMVWCARERADRSSVAVCA